MSWYEIPLDAEQNQEFDVTVEVGEENVSLTLRLVYNTEGAFWHMDVLDGMTGETLVSNAPLLPGYGLASDILRQLGYMGIGSAMIVQVVEDAGADRPGEDNLGTDFRLIWGKEDDG